MSNKTIVAPTVLGDAIRRLAFYTDMAPSIQAASKYPNVAHQLDVITATPDGVRAIAADLGVPVTETRISYGSLHTSASLRVGPVALHVFCISEPVRELHRPVDVTPNIEGRIDWTLQPPTVTVTEDES